MRALPVVLAVLLLAGCTAAPSGTEPDPSPTFEALPKPTEPAPEPAVACNDPALVGEATYTEANGNWFDTAVIGEGETVAIFVPQSRETYCGFTEFAVLLADRGIQSILINLCNVGATACSGGNVVTTGADAVLAAADLARANGATRVVAVGASMGGTTVIAASETAHDSGQLDAVASLSGPIRFEGINTQTQADDIVIPMFLAVSPGDSVVKSDQLKRLAEASSSPDWAQYSGSGHGWAMLFDSDVLTPTGSALVDFIAG
jgi:pimeloyl-ACP methyl ester carboxylesterase